MGQNVESDSRAKSKSKLCFSKGGVTPPLVYFKNNGIFQEHIHKSNRYNMSNFIDKKQKVVLNILIPTTNSKHFTTINRKCYCFLPCQVVFNPFNSKSL